MAFGLLVLPLLSLVVVNLTPRAALSGRRRSRGMPVVPLRDTVGFALAFTLCVGQVAAAVLGLIGEVRSGGPLASLTEAGSPFISLVGFRLLLDPLSLLALLTAGIVGAAVLPVGWSTLRERGRRGTFASLFLINLAGINGVALAPDLFTLYVFVEVVSISTYVLIVVEGGPDAVEGAFKYLVLSGVATLLLLSGVALLVLSEGEVSFAALARAVQERGALGRLSAFLAVGGLLVKGGFVPFHWWVPDAYTGAPTAVTALMAGISTKASGTFGILRIVPLIALGGGRLQEVLLAVATLSILVGAFAGLAQRDGKRMFAYSSVSQVGYIVAGIAAGNPLGLVGAMLHFLVHGICTAQLFGNLASVERTTGSTALDRSGGLGRAMPITSTTSVLASLSIAGIPPLSGFWSKLLVVVALWRAGWSGYAAIAVVASLLSLGYFVGWQRRTFWARQDPTAVPEREHGAGLLVPPILLTVLNVGIGLSAPFIIGLFVR